MLQDVAAFMKTKILILVKGRWGILIFIAAQVSLFAALYLVERGSHQIDSGWIEILEMIGVVVLFIFSAVLLARNGR